MLPLLIGTPLWLRQRGRAPRWWIVLIVLASAILLFALPFALPREHFDANGSTTAVPGSLYVFLGLLTVLPLFVIGAFLTEILRSGRARVSAASPDI